MAGGCRWVGAHQQPLQTGAKTTVSFGTAVGAPLTVVPATPGCPGTGRCPQHPWAPQEFWQRMEGLDQRRQQLGQREEQLRDVALRFDAFLKVRAPPGSAPCPYAATSPPTASPPTAGFGSEAGAGAGPGGRGAGTGGTAGSRGRRPAAGAGGAAAAQGAAATASAGPPCLRELPAGCGGHHGAGEGPCPMSPGGCVPPGPPAPLAPQAPRWSVCGGIWRGWNAKSPQG